MRIKVSILTICFFVDDLKLFATTLNNLKLLLDIVITFSKDIGVKFDLNKCAYIYTERGRRKSLGDKIVINEIEISELEEGGFIQVSRNR